MLHLSLLRSDTSLNKPGFLVSWWKLVDESNNYAKIKGTMLKDLRARIVPGNGRGPPPPPWGEGIIGWER